MDDRREFPAISDIQLICGGNEVRDEVAGGLVKAVVST